MDATLTSRVAVAINTHRAEVDEVDVQTGLDDAAEDVVRRAEVVLDRVPVVVVGSGERGVCENKSVGRESACAARAVKREK